MTNKNHLTLLAFLIIIIFGSCQKDNLHSDLQTQQELIENEIRDYHNETEENFFSFSPKQNTVYDRSKVSPFVKRINYELYLLNRRDEFVSLISEQIGDPDWSYTLEEENNSLWVPLIKNNEINGLFGFIIVNNTLYFKLYNRSYYELLSNGLNNDNVNLPISIFEFFENGSFNLQSHEVQFRECGSPCYKQY